MAFSGVSSTLWISNLLCLSLVLTLALVSNKSVGFFLELNYKWLTIFSIGLLGLTFFEEGIGNVYRWISVSGLKFNVGGIVSPLLLVTLSKIRSMPVAGFIFGVITLLFLLQPDASQVTAFSISGSIVLLSRFHSKLFWSFILGLALMAIGFCWINLDNLPPVDYVEGIVGLSGELKEWYKILALILLVLIPLPFFYGSPPDYLSMALGVYFYMGLISSFFGNFPVGIMGYGFSPILGYFIALTWLVRKMNTDAGSR